MRLLFWWITLLFDLVVSKCLSSAYSVDSALYDFRIRTKETLCYLQKRKLKYGGIMSIFWKNSVKDFNHQCQSIAWYVKHKKSLWSAWQFIPRRSLAASLALFYPDCLHLIWFWPVEVFRFVSTKVMQITHVG